MALACAPRSSASRRTVLGPRRLRRPGREDDTTIRPPGHQSRGDVGKRGFRPPPELVAGADVDDDQFVGGFDAEAAKPAFNLAGGGGVLVHFDRVAPARRPAEVGQQRLGEIPLVLDRVARAVTPRPRDLCRIHPAPAGDRVPDPLPGAGGEGEQRTARTAVEVDDRVETGAPQPQGHRRVFAQARGAAEERRDDHLVEVRVAGHDRRGRRLDQVGQVRGGPGAPDRADDRGRQHDVANQPQADEQDLQGDSLRPRPATARSWPRR